MTAASNAKAIISFLALGLVYYQSYLILRLIHATDIMWFIWTLLIPLTMTMAALGIVSDNERIDRRVRELLGKQ